MRVHYFFYMVNEEGEPIEEANVSLWLANSSTPAVIYTSESGSTTINTTPQLVTDGSGYFEFWVGDESETYGYARTQKFKITWTKGSTISGTLDYVDIFPGPYIGVDQTNNVDSTKNKLLSNLLAYGWETHRNTNVTQDGVVGPHNIIIHNDTTLSANSSAALVTENAVKGYVDNLLLSVSLSGAINTGVNVLDTFNDTTAYACHWLYMITKGNNIRAGVITAAWLSSNSSVSFTNTATTDLGNTTDVVMSVDINSNNVRLLATSASNSWTMHVKRIFI